MRDFIVNPFYNFQNIWSEIYKPIMPIAANNAPRRIRPIQLANATKNMQGRVILKAFRFLKYK